MTIQAVDITNLGIVMAADGAVSMSANEQLPRQRDNWRRQKLFRLDNLRGAIGYFGLAQIGNKPLHKWLENFIHSNVEVRDAYEFARRLADSLTIAITADEANHALGFHLSCYRTSLVGQIPEMHFIRNYITYPPSDGRRFFTTEELLGNHFKNLTEEGFLTGLQTRKVFFQNGYNEIYNAFSQRLVEGLEEGVWRDQDFTPYPKTIRDWGLVTEFRMRVVRLVFEKFHKRPGLQPVGGKLQFIAIPSDPRWPMDEWHA